MYILDTDHLSLYSRNNPELIDQLRAQSDSLITTVVNVEEQLRGRLAQIAAVKEDVALIESIDQLQFQFS